MGATASIQSSASFLTESAPPADNLADIQEGAFTTVNLKKLPEAIEESVFVHEKFCIIIDESQQASMFLKYQMGAFIYFDDPTMFNPQSLNRALVGAFLY
jgi:hypothetical protein